MSKRKIRSSDGEELEIIDDKPKGKPKPRQINRWVVVAVLLIFFFAGLFGVLLTPPIIDPCPAGGCVTAVAVEPSATPSQIPPSQTPVIVTATELPPSATPLVITATSEPGLCPEVMNAATGHIVMMAQIRDAETPQMSLMDGGGRDLCPLETDLSDVPAWSPDGRRFAYSLQSADSEIMVFDTVTQEVEQLTSEGGAYDPAWSPDGTQIVFRGPGENGSTNLYMMDVDGSNRQMLTDNVGRNELPAWSRDGSQIAFASNRDMPGENSGFEIYVMDIESGNIRRLTNNTIWDHMPAWSPDGSRIVFASGPNQAKTDLFIMDADCDGCTAENITSNGFANQYPVWLGENRIAYEADERGGDHGLYVINIETGDIERITRPVLQVMGFDWWVSKP